LNLNISEQLSEKIRKLGYTLHDEEHCLTIYKNGEFVGFFGSNTTIEMINKYIADIEKEEKSNE
jgi:hypothetical protein